MTELVYAPLLFGMTLTNMFMAYVNLQLVATRELGMDDALLASVSRPDV